jgi:hypothetical protein
VVSFGVSHNMEIYESKWNEIKKQLSTRLFDFWSLPIVRHCTFRIMLNFSLMYIRSRSPLNPWVEINDRAEFGAGIGFAAFE